jgi:glutathione S-transferase
MKIKLIYLDIPFWRAEISRIALYLGNIEFEDVRVSRKDFFYIKDNGLMKDGTEIPFNQLPCINIDGESYGQTGGIARFCGKLSGLYPKNDLIKSIKIDQIIDLITDITVLIAPTLRENDESKKRIMREELFNDPLTKKFTLLERVLKKNNNNCSVDNEMTIADIAIWRLMGWVNSLEYFPNNMLSSYPFIDKVYNNINDNKKISDWVKQTYK